MDATAVRSQCGAEQAACRFQAVLVTLVEGPALGALGLDQACRGQDAHVLAQGRRRNPELVGDEEAAHAVLHEVAIHLRRNMPSVLAQPIEYLQPLVAGQLSENTIWFHFGTLPIG